MFLVRSKQLLLSKPGINTLGNTSQLFFSYEREEEYSRVVVLFNNNNNNKSFVVVWIIFCRFFFFSLSSFFSLFPRDPPRLGLFFNRLLKTPQRPHFYTKTQNHTLKNHHGESTRGVLLGARMAVREEEQRVRPRVREPNAHVRGERQRDREARI